jgi:hypothetical protein
MELADQPHRQSWWTRRVTIAAVLLVGIGAAATTGIWFAMRRTDERPVQILRVQPVQRPPVFDVDSTWLTDNAPVLGVEARGRYRAYAISAFTKIDEHVVNDLLGGVPITVAYCNRTECARVYTDPSGNRPLAVAVGGWAGEPGSGPDGVMLLRVESNYYFQDTGETLEGWGHFPYPEITFERTTWGVWRHAHPDTDVFAGTKSALNSPRQ